jgi:hypothetical protein
VLQALTTPTPEDAYEVTTLGAYFQQHAPSIEVEILENSAWSCAHTLGRWSTGCGCTSGVAIGRGRCDVRSTTFHGISTISTRQWSGGVIWPLVAADAYISVLLGEMDGQTFLHEHQLSYLSTLAQQRLLYLLEAQICRQRMFTQLCILFEDLERIEARYAIANAIRAVALIRYATGDDLTRAFRRDLSIAVSPQPDAPARRFSRRSWPARRWERAPWADRWS